MTNQIPLLIHPMDRSFAGSWNAEPFGRRILHIPTQQDDVIKGKASSTQGPIEVFIYQDRGFDNIDDYNEEYASYHDYGMECTFDFTSSIETGWLIFIINKNNISQLIEYEYTLHSSPFQQTIQSLPYIFIISLPVVCIIIISIAFLRKRRTAQIVRM